MFITRRRAQSIADEMKAAIRRDINIMDESGTILASTNPARQGSFHRGASQVIRDRLPSLVIREDDPAAGVQRGVNLPIILDGQTVGVIGITGDPAEVSIFGDIIKRMTEIMVDSARRQEQLDLIDRAKGLFVENWLFAEHLDWQELEVRGRLLGFDTSTPYTAALLTAGGDRGGERLEELLSGQILRLVQNRLSADENHFCAVIRGRIIVLLCRTGRTEALELIQNICRDVSGYYGFDLSGGISGPSTEPADLRRCYLEARMASAAASRSPGGRAVFYDQDSLEFIVQNIPRPIREGLGNTIFSSCAETERRDFVQLVLLYYQEDADLQRCADRLFLHRSTVQYRLQRLRDRTGYDLRRPKDAILLYLAAQD